jgi:myo-inositol-1(or 4)-monophosphatase
VADFQREFEVAVTTACEAGELLREHFGRIRHVEFKSSAIDPVTEADKGSEALIASRLLAAFPSDEMLGEEGTGRDTYLNAERLWIVDPLDGTTNFLHGYPVFCVSIALVVAGEPAVGVIYDPLREELFTALRGGGAKLNGHAMQVSDTDALIRAMIATGFAYDLRWRAENLPYWERFIDETQAVRRDGSAALDLAYVACGRFDGYWERGVAPWDIAAAALMLAEAGGEITGYQGQPFDPFSREIVASNGQLHAEMLRVIAIVATTQPPIDGVFE